MSGIPELEVIEDASLRRASKKANAIAYDRSKLRTARKREEARIKTLARSLRSYMRRGSQVGKAFTRAASFYRRLGDLLFGEDAILLAASRINGSTRIVDRLERKYVRKVRRTREPTQATRIRKEAYGRMLSVLKRRARELEFLRDVLKRMRRLPSIETEVPVIAVAGCPNSGKSTLVGAMSSAAPEKAAYPFTTKEISIGHTTLLRRRAQVMDTPGLLDRPMEERNQMERQAILCLEEVANVVVFLFDGSPGRYYHMAQQVELLDEIQRLFPKLATIPALNKADLDVIDAGALEESTYRGCPRISALEGIGIDRLKAAIINSLNDRVHS
ncbi:MAG: NOG1 family protein [Candidatus Geothermarchaeales archaeon]